MIDRPDTRPEIEPYYGEIKCKTADKLDILNSGEA